MKSLNRRASRLVPRAPKREHATTPIGDSRCSELPPRDALRIRSRCGGRIHLAWSPRPLLFTRAQVDAPSAARRSPMRALLFVCAVRHASAPTSGRQTGCMRIDRLFFWGLWRARDAVEKEGEVGSATGAGDARGFELRGVAHLGGRGRSKASDGGCGQAQARRGGGLHGKQGWREHAGRRGDRVWDITRRALSLQASKSPGEGSSARWARTRSDSSVCLFVLRGQAQPRPSRDIPTERPAEKPNRRMEHRARAEGPR